MKPNIVATGVIDAAPDAVYRYLSDYENGHPNILPKKYFLKLEVKQGGVGAGTVVYVQTQAYGAKDEMTLTVTEPEPGRVLQEEDAKKGVCTHFTFKPVDGGKRCELTIATEWRFKPGLMGKIEQWIVTGVAKKMYADELALIAAWAQKRAA